MRINYIPNKIKYGALYNWYAASGITLSGWHLPSKIEWETLRDYLGGFSIAGGHLKETGTIYWISQSINTNNSTGFNGRGSGYRHYDGHFQGIRSIEYFWSSTPQGGTQSYFSVLQYSSEYFSTGYFGNNYAFNIRFLKDDTNNTGRMVDYDGNIYSTVTIGSQVWMAANLKVTHYNNGDLIPIVTDDTDWSNLTTGAMCYYNNDIRYA